MQQDREAFLPPGTLLYHATPLDRLERVLSGGIDPNASLGWGSGRTYVARDTTDIHLFASEAIVEGLAPAFALVEIDTSRIKGARFFVDPDWHGENDNFEEAVLYCTCAIPPEALRDMHISLDAEMLDVVPVVTPARPA